MARSDSLVMPSEVIFCSFSICWRALSSSVEKLSRYSGVKYSLAKAASSSALKLFLRDTQFRAAG